MTRRGTIDRRRVGDAVEAASGRTSVDVVVAIAPFFIGSVERTAARAFAQRGGRAGVFLFVIPARRQVIVLCDDGTRARCAATLWRELATQIAAAFSRAEGTRGLVAAVEHLASTLAGAFPAAPPTDRAMT